MERNRGILIHALAAAVACALSAAVAIAQPATGAATAHGASITGTIWRIDSRAGTFDLLTAVGHSLRVWHVRFAPDLAVKARGGRADVSALALNAVCRVDCAGSASMATATGIEILEPAPARTP